MCWEIFKPFINLLSENLRHLGPKNGSSNFLDLLYLAWLSRYKSTIERDFFHQWRKTSGCRARDVQVWRPESEFPWWQTDRQTHRMTTKVLSSRPRINAARPTIHDTEYKYYPKPISPRYHLHTCKWMRHLWCADLLLTKMRHLRCVVSPPIIITNCTRKLWSSYGITIIT